MLKDLAKKVERQPVSTLIVAATGVAATIALVRAAQDNPQYLRAARRQVQHAGERGAELLDSGARWVADSSADLAERGSRAAERVGARGSDMAERGASLLGDGYDAARDEAERMQRHAGKHGVQRVTSSMGIQEKTLAVFLATLLAKSVSGFFRWRSEQQVRHQAEVLASDEDMDLEAQLEEQTVAELRKQASDLEIAGRSSMNKDELVEAIKAEA